MKIALSFAGYLNSQRDIKSYGIDAFNYIKKHFLDRYDTDIYIHSWDIKNEDVIKQLYNNWIVTAKFEKQIDFNSLCIKNGLDKYPLREGVTQFKNVFSQLYSVQESIRLITDTKYDAVIKLRFDISRINLDTVLNTPYPVQFINFDPQFDLSKFYLAKWPDTTFDNEGPPDVWFYSSFYNMKKLGTIFDIAKNDFYYNSPYSNFCGTNDGGPLNTAKAWKWVLKEVGLWDIKIPLQTYIN